MDLIRVNRTPPGRAVTMNVAVRLKNWKDVVKIAAAVIVKRKKTKINNDHA